MANRKRFQCFPFGPLHFQKNKLGYQPIFLSGNLKLLSHRIRLIFSFGISREIAAVGDSDTTSIPALMELDGGGGSSGFCLVCSIEFVCLMVTCP